MSYSLGDDRDGLYREARDLFLAIGRAMAVGDAAVFRARWSEAAAWVKAHGFGSQRGTDLTSPENAGLVTTSGVPSDAIVQAVKSFGADMADVAVRIEKSGDLESAVQKGQDFDAGASDLLMRTARDLAATGKMDLSAAIVSIAKSAPLLWDAHSRYTAHRSADYWAYAWGVGHGVNG